VFAFESGDGAPTLSFLEGVTGRPSERMESIAPLCVSSQTVIKYCPHMKMTLGPGLSNDHTNNVSTRTSANSLFVHVPDAIVGATRNGPTVDNRTELLEQFELF